MQYSYDTHVRPYSSKFIRIRLELPEIKKAYRWALDMCDAKRSEMLRAGDSSSSFKRLSNGALGEIAVERLIGKQFIDWSIGQSKDYQYPDLISIGESVGVKTVEYGKFPVVQRVNTYSQIITIYRMSDQTCFICGLATADMLNTYQSDELILSSSLRRKGTKTGYYGFEQLIAPDSMLSPTNERNPNEA
jgi:hypothetical protein